MRVIPDTNGGLHMPMLIISFLLSICLQLFAVFVIIPA